MPLMPPPDPLPATFAREIGRIDKEIRALWQRLDPKVAPRDPDTEFIFSYVGPPDTELSPPYKIRQVELLNLVRVDVSARVPGTSTSTIELYQNGMKFGEILLGANRDTATLDGQVHPVREGDFIQVRFSVVGAGLEGPVVQMIIR